MNCLQSEEGSFEEGDGSLKRKAPVTEEDRKRRRQEINRQSARRIRERRSHELETLKQQASLLLAMTACTHLFLMTNKSTDAHKRDCRSGCLRFAELHTRSSLDCTQIA